MEPKPTLVALSPAGSGKRSSTGESDGLSDDENNTSYDDTDGDTDGERLVRADKPGTALGSSDDVCTINVRLIYAALSLHQTRFTFGFNECCATTSLDKTYLKNYKLCA